MIDFKDDPIFKLGHQQGAIDFCEFLRGKVSAAELLEVWEAFNKPVEQEVA